MSESIACPECGAAADLDAAFCKKCGTRIVQAIRCPSCRRIADADARYCCGCGTALDATGREGRLSDRIADSATGRRDPARNGSGSAPSERGLQFQPLFATGQARDHDARERGGGLWLFLVALFAAWGLVALGGFIAFITEGSGAALLLVLAGGAGLGVTYFAWTWQKWAAFTIVALYVVATAVMAAGPTGGAGLVTLALAVVGALLFRANWHKFE